MRQPRAPEARFGRGALLGLAAAEAGAAMREQGHGLLELPVTPVQLLHLGLVLRPHLAQLLQEMLVGGDQGAGGEHRAAPEPLPRPACCLLSGASSLTWPGEVPRPTPSHLPPAPSIWPSLPDFQTGRRQV